VNEPRIIKCPRSGASYNWNVLAERLGLLDEPKPELNKQKEIYFKKEPAKSKETLIMEHKDEPFLEVTKSEDDEYSMCFRAKGLGHILHFYLDEGQTIVDWLEEYLVFAQTQIKIEKRALNKITKFIKEAA
jgi:hypothetical protein